MKIIKPCNFRRIPRLRASPRHGGAVRCCKFYDTIRRGAPRRGRRGSSQIIKRYKHSTTHICLLYSHGKSLDFKKLQINYVSEGTVPVPRTAPALCDWVVLPSLGLSSPVKSVEIRGSLDNIAFSVIHPIYSNNHQSLSICFHDRGCVLPSVFCPTLAQ